MKYRHELDKANSYDYTNGNSTENGKYLHNGHVSTTDPSDDEYIDTVEVILVFTIMGIILSHYHNKIL